MIVDSRVRARPPLHQVAVGKTEVGTGVGGKAKAQGRRRLANAASMADQARDFVNAELNPFQLVADIVLLCIRLLFQLGVQNRAVG